MNPNEDELAPDAVRAALDRAGLNLTAEEAQAAVAGVNRWRRQVREMRKIITPEAEPAVVFRPPA